MMPKKGFKNVAEDNPALAFLGKKATGEIIQPVDDGQDVGSVQPVDDGHDVKSVIKYTHINLRVTQETKDYLSDASWQQRMNVTQYINALIDADIARNRGGSNNV